MMFIDLPDGCWYGDQNNWNTISVSGQKITQSKQIIESNKASWTKTEQKWMKVEQLMNNNRNWQWIRINSDSLNIQNWRLNRDHPTFAGVKYLCVNGTDNCNLFAQVLVMRHQMSCCQFLCFSSRLTCGLLKNHRTPSSFVASYLTLQCSTSWVS